MAALEEPLKSIFPDFQFTMELEKDKQLPLMDVMVTRTTNEDLTTTVYRKTTAKMRVFHFSSNHPVCAHAD